LKGFALEWHANEAVKASPFGPDGAAWAVRLPITVGPVSVLTSTLFSIIIFSGFWMHVTNCVPYFPSLFVEIDYQVPPRQKDSRSGGLDGVISA
jgi:hypothetical protein